MYDHGSEFIGPEFGKSLIEEECGITAKPITSVNCMSNTVLELVHQVLVKLVRTFNISQTYVDKNDPCVDSHFSCSSVCNLLNNQQAKDFSLGQLVFGRDMILPIKNRVDWRLICQKKQAHINNDNFRENRHRVEYDFKVGDNSMITKHTSYKYETPYMVLFVITQWFTNGMVNLQYGATQVTYNILRIKLYKYDTKVEYSSSKTFLMMLAYK